MAEFEFIAWLKAELAKDHAPTLALPLGPGDDTAILAPHSGRRLLAADMLLDGVHFCLAEAGPHRVGRKALAVNLSDIAAMAGTPEAATVSLALPRRGPLPTTAIATGILSGILELGREYGVAIAGGDTNSWDGPLVVSVAITGLDHAKGSVRRSGAQVGDWICVTGELGGSLATGRHLDFLPRVKEAQHLHSCYGVSAMLDISDGLGSDLRHILTASGVGARLWPGAIPIHAAVQAGHSTRTAGRTPLQQAMADGEDFELCFTVPPAVGRQLLVDQPLAPRLRLSHIGMIESGHSCVWDDGREVLERGWAHTWGP